MPGLDELKEEIREEASSNPEKFFATDVLEDKGFSRGRCENCGMYFWSSDEERGVCGEPECSGGYTFINDSPTTEQYSYAGSWKKFRDFMSDRGYTPIDRYPVVARWRNDVEFVGGSIYNFQPYVVSGEAEPPAEELVIPQPSLRFNDIDNVGITGRHYVLHDHIGQTCFKRENYDQDRYFRDMFEFAIQELGIPEDELVLHEDAWGGGGNLGACMEFFVGGLELWNQVYMFYRITSEGYEELDLKVLDMGMGHERITWISHGTETSYECVMPDVIDRMEEKTGVEIDRAIWQDFLPYSGYLNVDEVEDIDAKWEEIAEEMEIDVDRLKEEIKPVAALYSVAEHTRALLFALADGKLPSNTGGGHNLRVIYRRARDFIEKYGWDIDLGDVAEWHARELNDIFPELVDSIDEVREILDVEEEKYGRARQNAREKLEGLHREPTIDEMIELYESHGVSPEMMEEHGIEVPEDFYARVTSDEDVQQEEEERFDLKGVSDTELLYYKDEKQAECKAEVVAVRRKWVALDRTVFYPEGGGQEPDHGYIDDYRVSDVQKQDGVVLHHMEDHDLEKGDEVEARIEWGRRLQLMQHHSATHMVNGAAREVLGEHVWQAGAHKTVEKGRLDITHYEKLGREELEEIEQRVNEMIERDHAITKEVRSKAEAEKKYGFRIYQGGAVPGNEVRIVKIEDIDAEACGGTHLSRTRRAGDFLITGSKKIQDGVIRLEYRAGEAAEQHLSRIRNRLQNMAEELDVMVPDEDLRALQQELCDALSVDPEHLVDTVERFREENSQLQHQVKRLADYLDEDVELKVATGDTLDSRVKSLFNAWKKNEKTLESLETGIKDAVHEKMENRVVEEEVPSGNIGLLIQVVQELAKDQSASVTLIGEEGAVSASYHEDYDADENLEKHSDDVEGDENFAKAFDI